MILVLSLLALLGTARAGHVKGGSHAVWTQEKVQQEDIPSPVIVPVAEEDPSLALGTTKTVVSGSRDSIHHVLEDAHILPGMQPAYGVPPEQPISPAIKTIRRDPIATVLYSEPLASVGEIKTHRPDADASGSLNAPSIKSVGHGLPSQVAALRFVSGGSSPDAVKSVHATKTVAQFVDPGLPSLGRHSGGFGQRMKVLTSVEAGSIPARGSGWRSGAAAYSSGANAGAPAAEEAVAGRRASGRLGIQSTSSAGETVTPAMDSRSVLPSLVSDPGSGIIPGTATLNAPLVPEISSAPISPETIAHLERQIGGHIIVGEGGLSPDEVAQHYGARLGTSGDVSRLQMPRMKLETPRVQSIDYRKDNVILRTQPQRIPSLLRPEISAGNVQFLNEGIGRAKQQRGPATFVAGVEKKKPGTISQVQTRAGQILYKPAPALLPQPGAIPMSPAWSPNITPQGGILTSPQRVPISGMGENVFGNVGQVFEMSHDGKLVPASDIKAKSDYSAGVVGIQHSAVNIQPIAPFKPVRKPIKPGYVLPKIPARIPQPAIIPNIPISPIVTPQGGILTSPQRVPISGMGGNVFGNVGQVFEMSHDGKLLPVSDVKSPNFGMSGIQFSTPNIQPLPLPLERGDFRFSTGKLSGLAENAYGRSGHIFETNSNGQLIPVSDAKLAEKRRFSHRPIVPSSSSTQGKPPAPRKPTSQPPGPKSQSGIPPRRPQGSIQTPTGVQGVPGSVVSGISPIQPPQRSGILTQGLPGSTSVQNPGIDRALVPEISQFGLRIPQDGPASNTPLARPGNFISPVILPGAPPAPRIPSSKDTVAPEIVRIPQTTAPVLPPQIFGRVRSQPLPEDASLSPSPDQVPISGVDGNLFGRVGQVFELTPEGKWAAVSEIRDSEVDKLVDEIFVGGDGHTESHSQAPGRESPAAGRPVISRSRDSLANSRVTLAIPAEPRVPAIVQPVAPALTTVHSASSSRLGSPVQQEHISASVDGGRRPLDTASGVHAFQELLDQQKIESDVLGPSGHLPASDLRIEDFMNAVQRKTTFQKVAEVAPQLVPFVAGHSRNAAEGQHALEQVLVS